MGKYKLCIFLILFTTIFHCVQLKSIETMESTLRLLKLGEETIKYGHENIFLILGNTGSGKSTLAHFLAGDDNKLISKEVGKDTGEYIIEDLNDKVSNNSTLISKTLFPELVYDAKTKTAYYDCPGFSDTRNSSIDISSSYFVNRVITSAKSLKTVFVINYSSVKEGVDRTDFLKVLKHAATLYKNFEKYKNGVSAVISKVDNSYVKKGKEFILVSDEKILQNIVSFLQKAKTSIADLIKTEKDKNKIVVYQNAVKLVDIFLIKQNNVYTKLGLFRRPDEPGPLSKIKLLQNGKVKIQKLFQNQIQYVARGEQDFGFTISDESKNDITDLVQEISEDINRHVTRISNDVKNFYIGHEKQFVDINDLKNIFKLGYDAIADMTKKFISLKKPRELIQVLKTTIQDSLKIAINSESLSIMTRYDNFLDFIEKVNSKQVELKASLWVKSFEDFMKYLDESRNYFVFLIDFYIKLSDWSIQQNTARFNVNNFKARIAELEKQNTKVIGEHLKSFLDEIYYEEITRGYSIRGFDGIKNIEIAPFKFNIMIEMVDLALNFKVAVTCENNNVLVAKGDYIKLSEVVHAQVCPQKVIRYELYALQKIFVEQDFNAMGQNMQILLIAPVWEIVDIRQINMIGDHAAGFPDPKAPDGPHGGGGGVQGAPGGHGQWGRPGLRGLSGGSIFGISNRMLNGQNLVLKSIGGNGGPGQHGGNGGNGENGRDVDWVIVSRWKKRVYKNIFQKEDTCEQKGGLGGIGGNGGHGGRGGFPGLASDIQVIGLSENPTTQIQRINGQDGPHGAGGPLGIGGTSGNQCTGKHKGFGENNHDFDKNTWKWENVNCNRIKSNDGINGNTGQNADGIQGQDAVVTIGGKAAFVNNFRNFLNSNIYNHIKRTPLTEFLNILNNNPTIKGLQ